jgi:hypothetical protein
LVKVSGTGIVLPSFSITDIRAMSFDQRETIDRARRDLARRLNADEREVVEQSVVAAEFPDAALGAPVEDEMSAQVITSGWRILLTARGQTYEYRGNQNQLRLYKFKGDNHRV